MTRRAIALLFTLLAAGCARPDGTVRGQAPEGVPRTISLARSAEIAAPVTVQGTMVEK